MRANLTGMISKATRTLSVLLSLDRTEVGLQRHLGVYDDLALIREPDNEVGPLIRVAKQRLLLGKIAIFQHAGEFNHAPQLHLTPSAALNWRSQGVLELVGRLANTLLKLCERANLG